MDDGRINKQVFLWSKEIASNRCKNWVWQVKKFCTEQNVSDIFENDMNSSAAIQLCKPILENLEHTSWNRKLWNDGRNPNGNKLRLYRRYKTELRAEPYLNLNIPRDQRSAYIKLRCGVLPLEVETGRYRNTPLEERKCRLCAQDAVEDEIHFLMTCPKYDNLRDTMLAKATSVDDDFNRLNTTEKAFFLLSDLRIARTVIKTVNSMYLDRKKALSK